jgi:hypothetical protein
MIPGFPIWHKPQVFLAQCIARKIECAETDRFPGAPFAAPILNGPGSGVPGTHSFKMHVFA